MPQTHKEKSKSTRGPGGVIEAPSSRGRKKEAVKKADFATGDALLKPPEGEMPVVPRASADKAKPKEKAKPKVALPQLPPTPNAVAKQGPQAQPDVVPQAQPDVVPQAQPDAGQHDAGPQAQPDAAHHPDEAPALVPDQQDDQAHLKPGTPEYIAAEKLKDEEKMRRQEAEAEAAKRALLQKWYVPGQDDEATVNYVVNKQGTTPDNVDESYRLAEEKLRTIEKRGQRDNYKGVSDEDIKAVALYTTQAAYPVNAILRGQLKSAPWMTTYGPMAKQITKALKKMPKTALNARFRTKVDASKADTKLVKLNKLYRNDDWTPQFEGVFGSEFAVGRAFEEPAFFSATVVAGSYKADAPVRRTIEDAKFVRSVEDVALLGAEREALFPPGQRFQITSIELEDKVSGVRQAVAKPGVRFPATDKSEAAFNRDNRIWHVKLKHVGVATGKSKDAKPDKKAKGAKDADGPKKPSFLEHLLGIANVMD